MLFDSLLLAVGWEDYLGIILGAAAILVAILFFGFVILFVNQFKRCPSNRVLVIYGRTGQGQASQTIHGGAAFVWPLLQACDFLSLEPIQIEVPLRGALSSENIRVNVPSVFTVAIDTKPEVMQNAAVRLLGLQVPQIRKQAEEIILGQLRQVIATMGIEEINRDRDKFLQHIQHSLEPELAKIGLQLINVNITDITDESGYIDAIGQKAASLAIQLARGDVADNEKMGETRVAAAERDKSIQVSNARKEQSIGTREAQREQAVRIATLEKEQAIGEKTASFEKDSQVKLAEQSMRVQVAEADAGAIDGENQAAARVAGSQAELAIKKAEAYERGEGRRKQAEAAVLEIQNHALAKAALAEAERVEAEQRAKLEAPAKAQKAKQIVDAEATAEKRRIEARAEADAIFLKLEAEARGQYEILAKKGDGLKAIVSACGGSTQAFQMLMLEHLDNLADASARAISNIKFDKVVVWENGGANGRGSTADFLSSMAKTMPPMMQVMRDIGGIELPDSLVKLGGDAAHGSPAATASANGPTAAVKEKGKA
jgi:flotillin